MSEKFSKTGLSSGSSWSLFAENTAFEESDVIVERLGNSAETTRLHAEDTSKFGQCPSRQNLQLAVCTQCQKLLVVTAVQKHYELKHSKALGTIKPSPPKRCVSSTTLHTPLPKKTSYSKSKVLKSNNKSFIRIEEVDPNDTNVKIEEVPLTIPNFANAQGKVKLPKINVKKLTCESKKSSSDKLNNSTGSNTQVCIQVKGSIKKIPPMKDKEYDVDKHCGVWIPEMEKNCTRSLTCKTHPLSMRRQVPGRSKDFDDLLADHKNRVKSHDNASSASCSPQSNSRNTTPVHSPFGIDKIVFPTVPGPSAPNYQKDLAGPNLKSLKTGSMKSSYDDAQNGVSQHVLVDYITDDTLNSSNLPTISYHPKPIRLNSFGGRQTDCCCRLFSRRMDHFRNAATSMLDRYNDTVYSSSKKAKSLINIAQDGIRPAVQDPLQNGIVHKQKSKPGKMSGVKRQLSSVDGHHQGIIADISNYTASLKRRHSSDVPVVDPFSMANQQLNSVRSISNPSQPKLKKCQENGAVKQSGTEYLTDDLNFTTTTCSSSSSLTSNFLSSGNANTSLNSSLNLCQSIGILTQGDSPANKLQNTVDASFSSSKIVAAPNVTITPGMIVSLPSAVLQTNQQSYSVSSQIKELIAPTTPSRTVQQVVSTSASSALKQALAETSLTGASLPNGINASSASEGKTYSITFCNAENQIPAPNVTVTVTSSLSGVLQGHAVSVSAAGAGKTFKRLNSNHGDAHFLQQLIVQQSNASRDSQQKPAASNPTIAQAIQSPKQVANNLIGRHNFVNSPHLLTTSDNPQPMKQLQKMQQQQLQTQQFITMHHGYQQQILPKLPTVPQNVNQFHTQQFSQPATGGSSLQFISPSGSSNSLQQHHGGTIS